MTRPTENFTVTKGIIIGVFVNVVSLPRSHSCATPITPFQRLSATLAYTTNYSPTRLHNAIWKSHIAPPVIGNENYSTPNKLVKCCRSGRIGVCGHHAGPSVKDYLLQRKCICGAGGGWCL